MMGASINLPGYQIGEQIYLGSRTLVCRALRQSDQKSVIVKLMRNEYPSFSELAQFRNQYIISKNLNIDGIVHPLELLTQNHIYALVMEDFGGISLDEYFHDSNGKSLDAFFDVAIQIVTALLLLHRERIIHKDIKPANILINPDTKQVKLIDFSIASLLPKETQQLRNPNTLEGTLAYISPEQTGRMNRGVDYRTDFYSLGVTFYKLLTQQLPFTTTDPIELVHCHIAKQPTSIVNLNPDIPQALSDIVSKLMAKNAEERYQSAVGLKYDLEQCYSEWRNFAGKVSSFPLGQRDISESFIISEKLYGREAEVAKLLAAFKRVTTGQSELILVKGVSGIGKTAVINEVHKPIVGARGYFIKGKYDQFQRQTPFSGFVQALRDLITQLLSEDNSQLQYWKNNILQALGENAQVIIDVIPELEAIIGRQPPVTVLEGNTAQNRFNLLFQNFIRVFATSTHPLVIFLDDLQWADLESLKLIQLLMSQGNAGYMLLIGAYRDNEVSSTHPLALTLNKIHKLGSTVNQISLTPLKQDDLNYLIADTLNCSPELVLTLTELVYAKTSGNPFFCTQFLKALYEEKLIYFNFDKRCWECEISKVKEQSTTDDIIELMTQQLKKLPSETQNALKLAACISNQFDLKTLAIVLQKSLPETAMHLWKALQEGFILPTNETYKFFPLSNEQSDIQGLNILKKAEMFRIEYKFLHDRVQQAAYGLIPNDQKQITHLKIGKLLLEKIPNNQHEERIFDIVNHLNTGIGLITTLEERQELAQLNLLAAKKAKQSTAYVVAQEYLEKGVNLLGSECWNLYDLALQLHREKAEIEYLNGNFEACESLINRVLPKLRTNLEKTEFYNILVVQYTLQAKYEESIKVGIYALKLLNINLPQENLEIEFRKEYAQVSKLLEIWSIDNLLHLPLMQSQENIMAAKLLMSLDPVTYIGMPELYPIVSLELIKLSLKYGNTAESAKGYSNYGVILSSFFQKYESAYEFGKLAMNLSDKLNHPVLKCRTYFIFASFISNWYQHIKLATHFNDEAYKFGLEAGELQFSGYILFGKVINDFSQGINLDDILSNLPIFIEFLQKTQNQAMIEALTAYEIVLHNLSGITVSIEEFASNKITENEYIYQCQLHQSFIAIVLYQILKIQVLYIYGKFDEAYDYVIKAQPHLSYVTGFFLIATYNFYDSLILVIKYNNSTHIEEKSQYYEQLQKNQAQMKIWADSCAENFLHKYLLVEAEILRVAGKNYEAMELYDQAIEQAKTQGFVQEEALACELAAKFFLGWNKPKIAQIYLVDAYYAYARWGAKAKISQLEMQYPQLLASVLMRQATEVRTTETVLMKAAQTITSSSSLMTSVFDLATIMKASQAISGEINLERLLTVLMQVVLENAGASKSVLILVKNEQMFLEAEALVAPTGKVTCTLNTNLPPVDSIVPISILNYVKNSSKYLLIDDSSKQTNWFTDKYIQREQPQSILCLPIHRQGELIGLLYLENRTTACVFTISRIELLQLICSQAAISIENAQLYARMQDYAKQLETSLEDLKQMQLQLVQSEKMSALGGLVAGIAHEINNPIGCITGNIEPAQQYVKNLLEIIDLYQTEHVNPSKQLLNYIKTLDLEYIREDLPKLIESMKQSIDRIYDISISLRTFSRSDNRKPTICNIHECIDSTLLILKHRLKASQTRPQIEVVKNYGEIPEFECYPGQLNQVFMNLLANAIDALEESSAELSPEQIQANPNCITITTLIAKDKQSVSISIKDNGPGIPDDVKTKIFDHLFTTKPVGKGTGLGLAIARQIIVEKHQGTIYVNSSPNQGAEFVIQLPFNIE
ncbi:MAG: AAA family ATPase [Calothrix sp. C42_A2020_038]|nr:AAA family ATPase [Calothrix sp. C42_A2020_038]